MNINPLAKSVPASQQVAKHGIKNTGDMIEFLSALLEDTVAGRVDRAQAMTACSISQKILDVAKFHAEWLPASPQGELAKPGLGRPELGTSEEQP